MNVILITIDCLRADYLNCICNNENLSPNLDFFAENGVLFLTAIANGTSTPSSFPSIFTSTYPLMYPDYPNLSNFRTSITEILKKNGFKTAGFNSNPHLSKFYQYDKGFDFFDDNFSERKNKNLKSSLISKIKRKLKFKTKMLLKKVSSKYKLKHLPYQRAEVINQKALSWLEKNNSNFFLWLHYMDTHYPFAPSKKFRNISNREMFKAEKIMNEDPPNLSNKSLNLIKELYKGTIRYVDEELGRFFQNLKNLNLYNNSLIIITADHGEEFKEHGRFKHYAQFYDELIHVPLIINGPGMPKNLKLKNLISLIDLPPTILDFLDLSKREDFLGESFISLIRKSDKPYKRVGVISESRTEKGKVILDINKGFRITSYRTLEWKYIINEEKNTRELYNLKSDPYEKKNIYNDNRKEAEEFEILIQKHIEMESDKRKQFGEKNKLKKLAETIALNDVLLKKKSK